MLEVGLLSLVDNNDQSTNSARLSNRNQRLKTRNYLIETTRQKNWNTQDQLKLSQSSINQITI